MAPRMHEPKEVSPLLSTGKKKETKNQHSTQRTNPSRNDAGRHATQRAVTPDQTTPASDVVGDETLGNSALMNAPAGTSTPVNALAGMNPYDSYGGSGLGGMYGGVAPYGSGYGGAGYGSPYGGGYGMMPSMGMGPAGPLSNLNQFLFSVQSVIFSLGHAVQIIGMNTQALKQLIESVSAMMENAVAGWNEMQRIDAASRQEESEESKKKRRRLRAFRMALVTAVSYVGYRIIRRLLFRHRQQQVPRMTQQSGNTATYGYPGSTTYPPPTNMMNGVNPYGPSNYYPGTR